MWYKFKSCDMITCYILKFLWNHLIKIIVLDIDPRLIFFHFNVYVYIKYIIILIN